MIVGAHAIVSSRDAAATRAFLRDVLGLRGVDAGGGWLIFALPPAEVAAHPAEPGGEDVHRLYLMCDDLRATMRELKSRGARFARRVRTHPWGLLATIKAPGGVVLGLYEPRHVLAIRRSARRRRPARRARR